MFFGFSSSLEKKRFFLSLVVPFFLFYCQTPTVSKEILKRSSVQKQTIVFLPGYRGSEIYQNGKKIWLTAPQALALSTPDLRLSPENVFEPTRSLRSVTLIPYLIDADLYRPFLEHFEGKETLQWIEYPYDWRKDNGQTAKQIIAFLEKIKSTNGDSVSLIGHSNGGLLAQSIANQRPDLVSHVVLVGAPLRGGIGFMEDLMVGNKNGLNRNIVGPCVAETYELPFAFFPGPSPNDTKSVLIDESGKPLEIDFYSAEHWKRWELGPYTKKDRGCGNQKVDDKEFQNRLDKALAFRKTLYPVEKPKSPQLFKMLVVSAENRPSRRNIKRMAGDWSFSDSDYVPGDGRVILQNSLPHPPLQYEYHSTDRDHATLLNDPAVWKKIEGFLGI